MIWCSEMGAGWGVTSLPTSSCEGGGVPYDMAMTNKSTCVPYASYVLNHYYIIFTDNKKGLYVGILIFA